MQIYNTLTKKKEEFIPIASPKVTMYVCGPTVYDYFHIGNGRSFIMADIIRRYLQYKNYDVTFVMNITDIDDKIIKKSNEEKKSFNAVATEYTEAFLSDIQKLKIKKADIYPKATLHIKEIIEMIEILESKGLAYNVEGNVFYNVSKFSGYGKLSGKKIDELESGSRVEVNEIKKNPLDFSLWKKTKEGEPYWESPWGNGRPGWHIECSAMSCKHLGETIDIHAGGNDLIFPHHENEIAQSEGANNIEFVKYWIHFGFLNINEEKMSKSLGNFFTAREILKKYPTESIRLFFAQTHYAGPLSFSEELLASANKGLEKINNLAEKIIDELKNNNQTGNEPEFNFEDYYRQFESAMDDDFNSPQATAVIFDFVRHINKIIAEQSPLPVSFYEKAKIFLNKTASDVLGILDFTSFEKNDSPSLENELIELLINLRIKAKVEKNYAFADLIRDELKRIGITLQDGKDKTTYKKTI